MPTITPLPTREQARHAISVLVAAYGGNTRRPLRDVADQLDASTLRTRWIDSLLERAGLTTPNTGCNS